jgi:hypothetical protein
VAAATAAAAACQAGAVIEKLFSDCQCAAIGGCTGPY